MSCATTTPHSTEGVSRSAPAAAESQPAAVGATSTTAAAAVAPKTGKIAPTSRASHAGRALAPIPDGDAVSAHNPYTDGACDFCHKGSAKDPGPILKPVNELCFDCHTDFQEMLAQRAVTHPPAADACTNCHNPHNSRNKNLLLSDQIVLCTGCHTDIKTILETASVKHGALQQGGKCTNCHNPHASAVEKLLVQQPYDLCIQCHGKDGLTDAAGTKLTNMKTLLDTNPVVHAPVANKDCSACHTPHGGPNFRLLVMPYPARFYSAYDPENYALCFTCHDSEKVTVAETTTATNFRDGSRNLHYVHVNKAERGRTCRACHEVHAAKQPFQIRDGVPYGTQGWILKLNYEKTPNGGTCDKTCHALRSYDRKSGGAGK
jgi:predicted CXXCH cytochrome family protein